MVCWKLLQRRGPLCCPGAESMSRFSRNTTFSLQLLLQLVYDFSVVFDPTDTHSISFDLFIRGIFSFIFLNSFASVLAGECQPGRSLSSISSLPQENRLCHSRGISLSSTTKTPNQTTRDRKEKVKELVRKNQGETTFKYHAPPRSCTVWDTLPLYLIATSRI